MSKIKSRRNFTYKERIAQIGVWLIFVIPILFLLGYCDTEAVHAAPLYSYPPPATAQPYPVETATPTQTATPAATRAPRDCVLFPSTCPTIGETPTPPQWEPVPWQPPLFHLLQVVPR